MLFPGARSSPSFQIAVAGLLLAVVGYALWSYFRPNPYAVSEQMVRDFIGRASTDVRDFRRDLQALVSRAKQKELEADALIAEIDQLVASASQRVDQHYDEAIDRLLDLEIRLRTQRNRRGRIATRANEAKELIADLGEEAKEKLREE
jgi:uncharacterized membrane protein YccC